MPQKNPAVARCVHPLFPFPGHMLYSRGLAGDPRVCIAQGTQLSWDRPFGSFPHPWMGWQLATTAHPPGLGMGGCRLCKSYLQLPHVFESPRNFLCSAHTESSAWSLSCSPGTCCPSEAVHHPAAWSQPSLPTPLGMFGRDPEGQVTHRTAASLQVQHCSTLSGRGHGIAPIPRDPPALGDAA